MKTKLRFQRGVAVALFWPTTALLPYWLGASTEELANINHCIYVLANHYMTLYYTTVAQNVKTFSIKYQYTQVG